ncbi:MAG: MBOAT family protein [Oscillospiraceae bacterium]|nr:MBOAT family protein [Oscillospiraceae bacterium]
MVFSTLTFLCLFFPLVVFSYFLCKNRTYKNVVLLIFSLLFYAWGEPKHIILMLLAVLVAYIGGLLIDKFEKSQKFKLKKTVFIITIVILTLNLFIFKYLNFVVENVNAVFDDLLKIKNIALPIGISFYTFQILSYVIDLYKKEVSVQKNYFYLALYLSFFPQLIAGPIVRYQTVELEIRERQENWEEIVYGLRRFIVGLSKKVIIANNVGYIATMIFEGDKSAYGANFYWLAAIAYALQIYFDFSGYSDMAIGIGRIFGFHFLENFNYPYISKSITDFWRRWHISLSTWFRDYIYIPLGGNRVKKARWLFNILVVWALTGFWHGAQWNFLLWGLYYAVILIIEKLFLSKFLEKIPAFFSWLYAMVLVLIGWVIFSITDIHQLAAALTHMFSFEFTSMSDAVIADVTILNAFIYIPLGIICMLPWAKKIFTKRTKALEITKNIACVALLGTCIVFILSSHYNPFIYFRF